MTFLPIYFLLIVVDLVICRNVLSQFCFFFLAANQREIADDLNDQVLFDKNCLGNSKTSQHINGITQEFQKATRNFRLGSKSKNQKKSKISKCQILAQKVNTLVSKFVKRDGRTRIFEAKQKDKELFSNQNVTLLRVYYTQ